MHALGVHNRNTAIEAVRAMFAEKEFYAILETETTGLSEKAVSIWVTIMDLDGKILFDELFKMPKGIRMSQLAEELHGHNRASLEKIGIDFDQSVINRLEAIWKNRVMLIYNADFHLEKLRVRCDAHSLVIKNEPETIDLMEIYRIYLSQYNRIALPGRKNTGEGDCKAVLKLLNRIKDTELDEAPPPRAIQPVQSQKPDDISRWGCCLLIAFGIIVLIGIIKSGHH